jgi:hypothetical protein
MGYTKNKRDRGEVKAEELNPQHIRFLKAILRVVAV